MRAKVDKPDMAIGRIASRQHGVVSRQQLRNAGLGEAAIGRRVESGRLHRVHRGVYAVGHRSLPIEALWMAAVLACGEGAVLSHRSAACLWGLLRPRSGPVDVSIPGTPGRKRRTGLRLHRSQSLTPDLVTRRRDILVTKPARTIADLKRVASAAEHRRAIRQADVLGLDIGPDVDRDGTRSELERRFLLLCRRRRLPPPEVNIRLAGLLVDFAWRDRHLIVETDGYKFHRGRAAFEDDKARDLRLRQAGFDVLHFSYRQVMDHPEQVASALRKTLADP
ncbi:MAG TPA: type IV toxin-antitoxin system AbiEi family antitoxin domain-containing protein [Solirubrobacterales bacterium]|nr:type IV toxin-antitoxin system AbiEi family antitoxin domain-containing protein [Solirubrobacterales bacterium]